MALETFNNQIDITELSLDKPRLNREARFSPERDLTEAAWQGMLGQLNIYRHESVQGFGAEPEFGPMAADMAILAPERRSELNMTDREWKDISDNINAFPTQDAYISRAGFEENFSDQTAYLKILYPERFKQLKLTELVHDGMMNLYNSLETKIKLVNDSIKVLALASAIRFLFPQSAGEWGVTLNRGHRAYVRGGELLERFATVKDWKDFARIASYMRFLYPEETLVELANSDSAWQGMRETLERMRAKGAWLGYSAHAANMKILTAEKLIITKTGLELVMPEAQDDPTMETAKLPHERKF